MLLQKAVRSDQLGWAWKEGKNTQVEVVPPVHVGKSGIWNCFSVSEQMSHPGLMRHKPYPVFLPGGTKPPVISHKNGIVCLKKKKKAWKTKWETCTKVSGLFLHLGQTCGARVVSGQVQFSACRIATVAVRHFDTAKIGLAKMWWCPQKSL